MSTDKPLWPGSPVDLQRFKNNVSNLGSLLQDIQLVRAQGGMAAGQGSERLPPSLLIPGGVMCSIQCMHGRQPLAQPRLSLPQPTYTCPAPAASPQDITGWSEGENELVTKWRFSAILDLPWRPRLAAAGGTTHVFDEVGELARRSPITVHVWLARGGHCCSGHSCEGCIGRHLAACHMGTGAAFLHMAPCLNHRTMPPSFAGQPGGEAH